MSERQYKKPERPCSKCRGHGSTPPDPTVLIVYTKLIAVHEMSSVDATAKALYARLPVAKRRQVAIGSVHNALNLLLDMGCATVHPVSSGRARVWVPVEVSP